MKELEEADKTFKEMIKDDGGKIILSFLFSCMFMPKDEFEKFINGIEDFKEKKHEKKQNQHRQGTGSI